MPSLYCFREDRCRCTIQGGWGEIHKTRLREGSAEAAKWGRDCHFTSSTQPTYGASLVPALKKGPFNQDCIVVCLLLRPLPLDGNHFGLHCYVLGNSALATSVQFLEFCCLLAYRKAVIFDVHSRKFIEVIKNDGKMDFLSWILLLFPLCGKW